LTDAIRLIDISGKDLETTNLHADLTPLPYEGRGVLKPLDLSGRGMEAGSFFFSGDV
jgi:hypothetical protein